MEAGTPQYRCTPVKRDTTVEVPPSDGVLTLRPGGGTSTKQRGFALVLALSMMAFVLLLLLSMTLLVRVESVNSSQALAQLRAKESARLALMMALGDLQRHAGPDQRVTARAEILGDGNFDDSARFWTGVWDTTDESAPPMWLVSGSTPAPSIAPAKSIQFARSYDSDGDGNLNEPDDYGETRAELVSVDMNTSYAWWVIDEGVKAPITVVQSLEDEVETLPEDEPYLDYNLATKRIGAVRFDTNFDYPEFFEINAPTSIIGEQLERALGKEQVMLLLQGNPDQKLIEASLVHSHTLRNQFVLSNTLDGGLKKDLSYVKTIDAAGSSQMALDTLYGDPDRLITPDTVSMLQFRGNPTAFPVDEIIGMQLPETTIASINAKVNDFTIAPVVTEFQFSAGIVADSMGFHNNKENRAITTDSPVYFVFKIYLELWNPYTIPMMVGDETLPATLGYSSLRVEVKNLPEFQITNDTQIGNNFVGAIPDVSKSWGGASTPPRKLLRPGMVFMQTLPLDSFGDENSGAFHQRIGSGTISGAADDDYTGIFTFGSSPVEITIYGVDSASDEREILSVALDGYENFEIYYDGSSTASRLKRQRLATSEDGPTSETERAMSKASLEVPGYAFGIRFKALDQQQPDSPFADISNWISLFDPRNRSIAVDISDWSISDDAWGDDPLPYDFRVNSEDTDLSDFDPSASLAQDEFFQFVSSGSPREDRIARFIDLPTHEIMDVGIFRSLKYKDYSANSVGNPWGDELNKLYDRYFFSTLPDPILATWDGKIPLFNGRIQSTTQSTALDTVNTADTLMIKNGFNLNSTSKAAWRSLLSSKDYPADTLEFRDERAENNAKPAWKSLSAALNNTYINNPHSVVHNANDGKSSDSYQITTREDSTNYTETFSLEDGTWETIRQHPAFIQNIRELTNAEIDALSSAIVSELKSFYTDNGHPPLSMSEFINSSVLQDAIHSVPSINLRNAGVDHIPPHAPSYLSQASILNLIAPFSFVRSDTFRIRAYGEYKRLGGNSGSTYCEALVQRLPDAHGNAAMGRSFKVIDIRWITPEQ